MASFTAGRFTDGDLAVVGVEVVGEREREEEVVVLVEGHAGQTERKEREQRKRRETRQDKNNKLTGSLERVPHELPLVHVTVPFEE
jgi:hypothetical protein